MLGKTSTKLQHEGDRIYCKPIERAVLRDARLTFEARGLFCFLWDLPTGWEANSRHLANMSPRRRTAVLSILRELQGVGAMRIEPVIRDGKLAGRVWIIRAPYLWAIEAPIGKLPVVDVNIPRRSGNPTVEEAEQKVHPHEGSPNIRFTKPQQESMANREAERKGGELLAAAQKRHNERKAKGAANTH